ncbi:diaminopimelate decarboxylase [Pelagibius litoralis]|uniref:Diaminopimelate decarboxylase n=1 Tax=Pelagibius litoralis TaxID=374515 RepID=A0A967C856_9PROT|nr:diaminopimelate decarboxylase [Pelagibius litoralis]NIA68427.1 diaminopimelate decarboxylase [Pelagibius litoralis]
MSRNFFPYRDGRLHVSQVPLDRLAEEVGTPFYCYSGDALESGYRSFAAALSGLPATICYALKANSNQAVIKTFAELGAGADVVSEGELRRALAAGVPAERIVFAGVGKTAPEMAAGLDAGIMQFNVESFAELELLSQVAQQRGTTAPVAVRVNPNVDAGTLDQITTGRADSKFGIDADEARAFLMQTKSLPGIRFEGLAVHIGSQLTDVAPYRAAFQRLIGLYHELRAAGVPLRRLDLGGGIGISYKHDLQGQFEESEQRVRDYTQMVRGLVSGLDAELVFEPGRLLVGNAGLLVTRVLFVKDNGERRFVIVDAAMNDLIRPSLYDAWHEILPVAQTPEGTALHPVDVVGPVCESTDTFAKQRPLPPLREGDLLVFSSAGAYSFVMASTYNSRPLAPEVLVRGDRSAVVRARMNYDTMIGQDRLPDWLDETATGREQQQTPHGGLKTALGA